MYVECPLFIFTVDMEKWHLAQQDPIEIHIPPTPRTHYLAPLLAYGTLPPYSCSHWHVQVKIVRLPSKCAPTSLYPLGFKHLFHY